MRWAPGQGRRRVIKAVALFGFSIKVTQIVPIVVTAGRKVPIVVIGYDKETLQVASPLSPAMSVAAMVMSQIRVSIVGSDLQRSSASTPLLSPCPLPFPVPFFAQFFYRN